MRTSRFISLFLCISLVMSILASASELSKLYEEDFSYESEYVSAVLQSSTVLVYDSIEAQITYKPVTVRTDLLIEDIVYLRSNNPEVSLESVYDFMLNQIYEYLYFSSAVTAPSTAGIQGSGVIISEDGYIATNRHVVEFSEEKLKEIHLNSVISIILENCESIIGSIESIFGEGTVTEEMINELLVLIEDAYLSTLNISGSTITYYVFFPGSTGEATLDFSRALIAEVVNIGGDAMIEDAAIIKVDADNLIALNLVSEYPNAGSELWAAGFPAVAEISESSMLTATITTGKVSGIKKADVSSMSFIQTEAAISGGNSGGPSVDKKCNVVGLNTYGAANKDNFNFIVPYEMVDKLSSEISIGQGEFSKIFMAGIQAMQEGYGSTAVECFEKIAEINPNIPYINKLIQRAKKLPGLSKTLPGAEDDISESNNLDIKAFILYGGIALIAAAFLVIVISLIKKSRRRKAVYATTVYSSDIDINNTIGEGFADSLSLLTDSDQNSSSDGGDSLL